MDKYREREDLQDRMLNMEDFEFDVFGWFCPRLAEKKRTFQRDIENLFRPFVESGREQSKFQWGCVISNYNVIKNDINRIWSLRMCCAFVLKLFCTFDCEDHQLIARIIYIYHQVLHEYEHGISFLALCGFCMRLNYPKHFFFEELKGTLSILSKINKEIGNTYRFTNYKLYSKLTIGAFYEGDYVFIKFLVKYGLSCFPEDEQEEAALQLKRLEFTYKRLQRLEGNGNEMSEIKFAESVLQQLIVGNPNIRRLILIMRYVFICLRRRLGDSYYPDYVKCLNLFVLTLPEAAISLKDVEDFLNLIFTDNRAFITEMSSDFQEVFPESSNLSLPRSLQHLCRCTVRDSIQKHSPLPYMLSDMTIPKRIKDYLLILSD